MAAFNFPNSPSTNDLHTENGVTYKWNGTVWKRQNASYTDATNLNVTGISTFAGAIDSNSTLEVAGIANFDSTVKIADKIEHLGDSNTNIRFPANDTITAETSGSEKLRIDSSGRIGIGTVTPSKALHVYKSNEHPLLLERGDSANTQVELRTGGVVRGYWGCSTTSNFMVYDNDTSDINFTVLQTGKVGIGTNSQSFFTHIQGDGVSSDVLKITARGSGQMVNIQNHSNVPSIVRFSNYLGNAFWDAQYNTDNSFSLDFQDGEKFRITSAGTVGINRSSPDSNSMLDVMSDLTGTAVNSNRVALFRTNGGGRDAHITLSNSSNTPVHIGQLASNLYFTTNNAERLRIQSGGDVLIGTTTSAGKLTVDSGTSNTCATFQSSDAGAGINLKDNHARSSIEQNGTTLKIVSDTGGEYANSDIRLQVDGSTKMKIDHNGKFYKGGNQFYPLINYYEANLSGSVDNSQTGSFSDVKTIVSGYQPKKVGSRLVVHHAVQTWNGSASLGTADAYARIIVANGSGWQQKWINMRLLGNFAYDERYSHRTEHAMFSFVTAATSIDMKFQAYNGSATTTINYYHTGEQNLIQIYEYDIT